MSALSLVQLISSGKNGILSATIRHSPSKGSHARKQDRGKLSERENVSPTVFVVVCLCLTFGNDNTLRMS